MVGIISKTDIVRQISHCQSNTCRTLVKNIMTKDVTFCTPKSLLQDVWEDMKKTGITNVPIIDKNYVPIDILNAKDALLSLLESVEYEEALLRDYVIGIGYR